jgi:hypothetical protein
MQQAALLSSSTPEQLLAAATSFQKLNGSDALAIEVYVLSLLAGGSTDPKVIANAATCFFCKSDGMLQDIATYLLAANNNASTDPKTLLAAVPKYQKLWGADFYVLAYLYAQAGVASGVLTAATATVDSLINASRCFFMCVQSAPLLAMLDYLLCQLNAIGGFTGTGPNLVPPGSVYNGSSQFLVNIQAGVCYNVCWGANEVSAFLAVSGQTFQSSGAGTCTALWSSTDTTLLLTGTVAGSTVTAQINSCSCGICSPRPINFTFANNLVGGTTTANWNAPPAGVTATQLWTSSDNITYNLVATVAAPGTSATVAQPAAGAFLWGKIRHVSGTFFSSFTPPIEVSGLLNGLVSYWNLDNVIDNPGGAIDNFGSNNLTNRVGGAGFIVKSIAAKINNGGDWHTNFANSPYLSIPVAPASLRLGGAASMTAAMWVKFINNGNNAGVFGVFGPVNEYLLWFNTVPSLEWNVRNGAGANVPLNIGNQTTGVYHFIVVGFDNANSQLFYSIDGGARVNGACVGTSLNGGAPIFELGNYSNGFPSDVNMDEVGWWNRVLNAAEIAFLYNGGSGKTLPL